MALRVLAITMVHNEGTYLDRWIRYYGGIFGRENLLVLDHGSTDGSTCDLAPTPVIRLPREIPTEYDRNWFDRIRTAAINRIAAGFLRFHDAVIYADADEFLFVDPSSGVTLPEVIARCETGFLAGLGINILHDPRTERPLDPRESLLGQRTVMTVSPGFCKPLVRRSPEADWLGGFHGATEEFTVDPHLYVIHTKFADMGSFGDRHDWRHQLATGSGAAATSWWSLTTDEAEAALGELVSRSPGEFVREAVDPTSMIKRRKVGWRAVGAKAEHQLGPYRIPDSWVGAL